MSSAFIQAAVILLREGLEAMLVIAALAAYLTKAGAAHRIGAVWRRARAIGAASSLLGCFAVLNSASTATLEGVIILVARRLMLYVSGWLMVKQDPRGWQDYLAHKATAHWRRIRCGRSARSPSLPCSARAPRPCCSSTRWRPPKALGRRPVRGPRGGDAWAVVLFYFINTDRAEDSAAATVHHHLRLPVCDGDQVHRRGVQEFQEQAILPFTELKGVSWLSALG